MNSKQINLLKCYQFIGIILMGFATSLWVTKLMKLTGGEALLIIIGFLFTSLYFFFQYTKKVSVILLILLIGFIISFIFTLFYIDNVRTFIAKLWQWFISYRIGEGELKYNYFLILHIVIVVILHLVYFISLHSKIGRYVTAIICLVTLYLFSIRNITCNKISIAIFLLFIIATVVEFCNDRFQAKENANLFLLPFCILFTILAVCLPSKNKPIQWTVVKNFVKEVTDNIHIFVSDVKSQFGDQDNVFTVKFTGYADHDCSALGGDISDSDQILIRVKNKLNFSGEAYLTGTISDEYTGYSWKRNSLPYNESKQEYMIDYKELLFGFFYYDLKPEENEEILKQCTIELKYDQINTRTLFYPSKLANISVNEKKKEFNAVSPSLLFEHEQRKGCIYQANYYTVNLGSETLQNYFRNMNGFTYDNLIRKNVFPISIQDEGDAKSKYGVLGLDEETIEKNYILEMKKRSNMIRRYYTQLPDSLPLRVRELATTLTQTYDNDYDRMRALETYISSMEYTKTPGPVLEGRDFVDSFLFDKKKGYCTHFATALAIMGRCIGVPTRYVEGLVLDDKSKVNSEYLISSDRSHAWVEAYFEGVGWIPFEATASYHSRRYKDWERKYPVVSEDYQGDLISQQQFDKTAIGDDITKTKIEEQKKNRGIYSLVALVVIILAILLTLVLRIHRISLKMKYLSADNQDKILLIFTQILNHLATMGYRIHEDETLVMYYERLQRTILYDTKELQEVTDIFMKIRYGGVEATSEDLLAMLSFEDKLKDMLRKKLRMAKMLLYNIQTFNFGYVKE